MVDWFDLPAEVKQIIFTMVSDAHSIIYVPRDRRRKVDLRHLEAHHFHDLLLVSKDFITPEDFSFAILTYARLTFYSYNELRRLITEISSSFKQCVRRIHLSRKLLNFVGYHTYHDTFDGFCSIDQTLSTQMPQLRQIYVSWPEHCAQLGCFRIENSDVEPNDEHCVRAARHILSDVPDAIPLEGTVYDQQSLAHVAASFVGNRSTGTSWRNWTRPVSWIRRLMLHAEKSGIEVVLQINVCIAYRHPKQNLQVEDSDSIRTLPFQLPRASWPYGLPFWQLVLEGEMSSRDYVLNVTYKGELYTSYQKLAYDMLHSPPSKGSRYWQDLVAEVPNPNLGSNNGF